MKRELTLVLCMALATLSLQHGCEMAFNNVHNGYRYSISGDCSITDTLFSITPKVVSAIRQV